MPTSLRIEGIDEIIAKLGKAVAFDTLTPPMNRSVLWIQRDIAVYPPPAKQRDGYKGPKYIRGVGFEGGPRTSERLGQKWTTEVKRTVFGLTGKVGTNVSYAPYVQHDRSFPKPHQTLKHIETGWVTDKQVIEKNVKRIVGDFEAAIRKATA